MLYAGRHTSAVESINLRKRLFPSKECHYLGLLLEDGFGSAGLLWAEPTHLDGLRNSSIPHSPFPPAAHSMGHSARSRASVSGRMGRVNKKDEAAARVFSAAASLSAGHSDERR